MCLEWDYAVVFSGSKLRRRWLWQQCFINPFLKVSAISCLNMNGMIGTSHTSSSKESLFAPFSPLCLPLFPFSCYLPPPASQSLDWVLMTVAAGHLGRPRSQLGGPVSPPRYPLPPPLRIVLPNLGPAPILSGPEQPPNIEVVTPGPVPCVVHHPSPHTRCSMQKCAPPLHSALCSCRASPIPPHVVLISTQRASVKTTNYVDTRAEFTQKPHTPGLYSDPCVFWLDIIPSSLAF